MRRKLKKKLKRSVRLRGALRGPAMADGRLRSKRPTRPPRRQSSAPVAMYQPPMRERFRMGRGNKGASSNRARLAGTIYLGALTVTSGVTKIGDTLKELEVSPHVVETSILKYMSNCFEGYKIHKWKVHFTTQVGTSSKGEIIIYTDPDPDDSAGEAESAIRKAMSAKPLTIPVWQAGKFTHNFVPMQKTFLWTSEGGTEDLRLQQGGKTRIMSNSDFSYTDTIGSIVLEYDIEFVKPMLESVNPNTTAIEWKMQGTGMTTSKPWGDRSTMTNYCNPTLNFSYESGHNLQSCRWNAPGAGDYFVVMIWSGTGFSANPTFQQYGTNATMDMVGQSNTSNTYMIQMYRFHAAKAGDGFGFATITATTITTNQTIISTMSDLVLPFIKPKFNKADSYLFQQLQKLEEKLRRLEGKQEIDSNEEDEHEIVVVKSKSGKTTPKVF